MKKLLKLTLPILVIFFLSFFITKIAYSDTLDDINKKLSELQGALSSSQKATAPLESQLNNLKSQLKTIENKVAFIESDLASKRKFIDEGYKELDKQKDIFNQAVRNYYIKSYLYNPIIAFLSSVDAANITRLLAYQKKGADQDKAIITNIAIKLTDLEERKIKLEEEESKFSGIKEKLALEKGEVEKIVLGAKAYQSSLSSQIVQLTAQQQQLIAQKLGSLNIPRSAGTSARGCTDDRGVDPGFSPRLAFFTYGAPHRNGLNQYGAKGRADAGQNAEQMLQEYYPSFSLRKDYDQNAKVNVDGNGEFTIENYTKHIFEVPETWPMETLKAQAVAARTYALNSMQRNGHICTTESCQVFHAEEKGGRWNEAVAATAGWVLMDGANPGFTQYASTHGGYILNLSKFDGRVANPTNFSELNDRSYDKESPWFYCDWGSRANYSKTAWLKPSEVADIANVILLAKADSATKDHLYQTDKPHPYGGEVWNEDRVKQELRSKNITPFNNVSDIEVRADFGSGKTTSVNVSGDSASSSFDASEFKDWFNLRAPANIQIVGPLFNAEKQ